MEQERGIKILITGAAGSVGSALIKSINLPDTIVYAVDNDDHSLWTLKNKVQSEWCKIIPILADVREKSIELIDAVEKADYIIHCAAYKNIEITENFVEATVLNDFNGTTNMLELIRLSKTLFDEDGKPKTKLFLLISSDKAVHPISTLGAAKMLAEKAVLNASERSPHKFSIARFVNVVETRGNVFERWREEKKERKPLSITDEKMKRYFVSMDYIVKFIWDCIGFMMMPWASGGTIFIPEHGKLIPVIDKMKELYGKNQKYNIIGIRKNEKLIDELYTKQEKSRMVKRYTQQTEHLYVIPRERT